MGRRKGWLCVFFWWNFLLLSLFCLDFFVFFIKCDPVESGETLTPDSAAVKSSGVQEESGWPAVKDMVEEGAFLLERDEQEVQKEINKRETAARPSSSAFSNFVTMALATALLTMIILIAKDAMNFVGDVPDPFEKVTAAEEIPAAIQALIDKDTPLAFVVRRCKYCGTGIKAMRKAGYEPVVVMVEGHKHRKAINGFLRQKYLVQGYPYFFLNRADHGYLSQLKEFLQ